MGCRRKKKARRKTMKASITKDFSLGEVAKFTVDTGKVLVGTAAVLGVTKVVTEALKK